MIQINNLSLKIGERFILKNIHFELKEKTIHSFVGESGSGKSTLLNLILGIKIRNSNLEFEKFEILGKNYSEYTEKEFENIRGKNIALIPQNPARVFHPYISIGEQIKDYFQLKKKEFASRSKILELWEKIKIRDFEKKFDLSPNKLSGGEKQRIIIQTCSILKPEILLADEPTTALDSISEKEILEFLMEFYQKFLNSILLVSHDPRIIRNFSDEVSILKSGEILEKITLLKSNSYKINFEYSKNFIFG